MSYYHNRRIRQLVASVARVACPSQPSPDDLADEIASHTELSIRAFPTPPRLALLAGMTTYDEGARLFFPARGKPARALDKDTAGRYFATWWSSPIGLQRDFAKGLKGLICLAYYETAPVKEHLGYTPDAWIKKVTARRLEVYSDDIARQRAAILAPDPLGPLVDEV